MYKRARKIGMQRMVFRQEEETRENMKSMTLRYITNIALLSPSLYFISNTLNITQGKQTQISSNSHIPRAISPNSQSKVAITSSRHH